MNRITELKTPADMLRKAKAEFEIMKENTDAYTVFNFFVTALHIKDYVAVYLKIEDDDYKSFSESIRKFSLNEEWDIIDSIGNKGKHFALRKRKKNVEILTKPKLLDGSWKLDGSMKLDGIQWNISVDETRTYDLIEVSEQIISFWERYFKEKNIPLQ